MLMCVRTTPWAALASISRPTKQWNKATSSRVLLIELS
jgi:hypothetical protein